MSVAVAVYPQEVVVAAVAAVAAVLEFWGRGLMARQALGGLEDQVALAGAVLAALRVVRVQLTEQQGGVMGAAQGLEITHHLPGLEELSVLYGPVVPGLSRQQEQGTNNGTLHTN